MVSIKKIVVILGVSAFLSACGGGESADAGAGVRDADPWWAEIETCVNKKETAKKNSGDSHIDPWMYQEWEDECAKATPDIPSAAGLNVSSTPLDELKFDISVYNNFNTLAQRNYTILSTVSLNDDVTITDFVINRGNCGYFRSILSDVNDLPVKVKYAEKQNVYLKCKVDAVREVTIVTTVGEITYSIQR